MDASDAVLYITEPISDFAPVIVTSEILRVVWILLTTKPEKELKIILLLLLS